MKDENGLEIPEVDVLGVTRRLVSEGYLSEDDLALVESVIRSDS